MHLVQYSDHVVRSKHLASRLSIKRVLTSTVLNIIHSGARTYFAKQSFLFRLPPMDGRSVCPTRPLLLILFGIHLVAPIAPSRLRRFSKLVAHCTGRWVAQRLKRMGKMERRGCAIDALCRRKNRRACLCRNSQFES